MIRAARSRPALILLAALTPLLAGCNKKLSLAQVFNQRPTVRLSASPVDTLGPDGKRATYIYHYRMDWIGNDPDGRVDHFLYTIDPPGSPGGGVAGKPYPIWADTTLPRVTIRDTVYNVIRLNEKEIFFKSGKPDEPVDQTNPLASEIHTFVIKAVDNNGAESAPEYRSFFANTQAPTVTIDTPSPSAISYALVTPFLTVQWHGSDPDGVFTQKPLKYKFKLFKDTDHIFNPNSTGFDDFNLAQSRGDSLRHFFAPNFAGWDSTTADSTFHTYTNLVPDSRYLFVVVGFDEAGAYSPIFNRNVNMLQMQVTFAGNNGPIITVFNEFFNYTYAGGAYNVDPSRYINLEVPAFQPIRFFWGADAPNGSAMKQYRWAMDISNLDDQTPREDERKDTKHWSQAGLTNTFAQVGPFTSDTTHIFYIEAEDVNGLKSLGIVSFHVVVPTFNHDLLVVNDTRLLADQIVGIGVNPDSIQPPPSTWPSRAELDTFLFARGGVRWRFTPNGTLSPPGIFAGYKYDTVYTAAGGTNGFVTLDTLSRYRHVVWLTDPNSASGFGGPNQLGVLRNMSAPRNSNTLAAYVILGGLVWMAGGGAVDATLQPWNITNNDRQTPLGVRKYSNVIQAGRFELTAGRMVFDLAYWRSEIWVSSFDLSVGTPHKSLRTVGGWPSFSSRFGFVRSPDYSLLPSRLRVKNRFDDAPPPYRLPASFYALPPPSLEVLVADNVILEDGNPDPDTTVLVSTLDTLMIMTGFPLVNFNNGPQVLENENLALGGALYHSNPCMTYYHGFNTAPFICSGFDLWNFNRTDTIKLVDFVLQQIWGLTKEPITAPARAAGATRTRSRS